LGETDFTLQLERLRAANVQAIIHWGDAQEGALILNQMRESGMNQPYFASDRAVDEAFVRVAGKNIEGVTCTFPWNPNREDPRLDTFREDFVERFGVKADTYAAHGYDGMQMLIWGVQVAGLNRAKIRDVLAYRSKPWPGVTGNIALSAALDDVGEVTLAKYVDGEWLFFTREELEIPRGEIPARDRVNRSVVQATGK